MFLRLIVSLAVFAAALNAQFKAKMYEKPESCISTYQMAVGRVLTSRGLVEDPTVNAIMKDAVAAQTKLLNIREADKGADVEVRFAGGTSAGLQEDDPLVGTMAIWNVGGVVAVNGRTFKKSSLVLGIVDNRSNRTIWAARYADNFGDPARLKERIQKGVAKAFSKFPKEIVCGDSASPQSRK